MAETDPTTSSATRCSAKSRTVHRARPSGGAEHANRVTKALKKFFPGEWKRLTFATLAQDADAIRYYAAEECRCRHILRAVEADLAFLRNEGFNDAYMLGIYHQAGAPHYNTIDDIPAERLRLIVQIADSHVRKLRRQARLEPWQLPSAGEPFRIRGPAPPCPPRNAPPSAFLLLPLVVGPSPPCKAPASRFHAVCGGFFYGGVSFLNVLIPYHSPAMSLPFVSFLDYTFFLH